MSGRGLKLEIQDSGLRLKTIQAIQVVAVKAPSFLPIIYKVPIKERKLGDGYAATNGKVVYLDPELAGKLSPEELAGTLIHEALHIALRHVNNVRIKTHGKVYNVATDALINHYVSKIGFKLPKDVITPETISKLTGVPADTVVKLSADEIYYLLLKRANIKEVEKLEGDVEDEGIEGDDGEGEGDVDLPTPEDVTTAFDWHSAMGFIEKAAIDPVELRRQLGIARTRLEWKRILRNIIMELARSARRYSWIRESRKLGEDAMGRLRTEKPKNIHVIVMVDVSGSTVAEGVYEEFLNEVAGIVKVMNASATLITWDHDVTGVYHVERGKWNVVVNLKPRGGGGTDPMPATQEALKETKQILAKNPRARVGVVMFTDGLFSVSNPAPLAELARIAGVAVYCYTVEDHPEWFPGWVRVKIPILGGE